VLRFPLVVILVLCAIGCSPSDPSTNTVLPPSLTLPRQGGGDFQQVSRLSPDESLERVMAATPRRSDLREIAVALGAEAPPPRVTRLDAKPRTQGEVDSFWVARQNPPSHKLVSAELRRVSRRAYWYVQEGLAVSDDSLRTAADAFDNRIYPEVRRLVGSEVFPGIDNDSRITIFHGSIPGLAGYVSSTDSYPPSVRAFSNEREIVYLNPRVDAVGTDEYLATLTHEFTHVVHWQVNPAEDTWAKEGLGFLMPSLVFPERRLASGAFAAAPNTMLTTWTGDGRDEGTSSTHYQSAAWFLRYLVDRYGAGALSCLLQNDARGLARNPPFPTCGYPTTRFAEIFQDWVVANLVGTQSGPGVSPYLDQAPNGPRIQRLDGPTAFDDTVAQFGAVYYELPRGSALEVELTGRTTVPVLSGADDGGPIWYSGRSDGGASTMSRAFDLSAVRAATLEYDVWFDTESDYDYLYALASRDGGKTWALLSAPSMSTANPSGNSLGIGYTGRSGEWLHESLDLTPYAGGPVSLAFWYVTDDAVTGPGAALRDLRVEAVEYRGDPAASDDGWAIEGWSPTGALLPQIWSAQLVELGGGGVRAGRLQPDAAGRVVATVEPDAERTILVVSGLTPVTLERASFHLDVRRR
jgi:immune inhibitor A